MALVEGDRRDRSFNNCPEGSVQIKTALIGRSAAHALRTLPIADAAGFAGPDLNPRIERLGIERIAVPPGEPGSRRAARLLRPLGHSAFANNAAGSGFRLGTRLRARTAGISLDRNRREGARRPKRLRRQHRLREVKTQKFARPILVGQVISRGRQTAPRPTGRRKRRRCKSFFQAHFSGSSEIS